MSDIYKLAREFSKNPKVNVHDATILGYQMGVIASKVKLESDTPTKPMGSASDLYEHWKKSTTWKGSIPDRALFEAGHASRDEEVAELHRQCKDKIDMFHKIQSIQTKLDVAMEALNKIRNNFPNPSMASETIADIALSTINEDKKG